MAASWKWVGIWTGIHERDSAFQTIQGRSVFTTLDWAVSHFRVAECWLPIVSSIWNKLHPLHQSRTVIGPRGWSEAPQASYFWLWISRSLKSVWDEDLFGLEFLMYFQVQNFVHNLTVENYMDSWVGYLCVCSTVALPTRTPRSRWSSKDGQTKISHTKSVADLLNHSFVPGLRTCSHERLAPLVITQKEHRASCTSPIWDMTMMQKFNFVSAFRSILAFQDRNRTRTARHE